MSAVKLRPLGPGEYAVEVEVTAARGRAPAAVAGHFVVTVDDVFRDDLPLLEVDRAAEERVVRESVAFLLEREPVTAIRRRFSLSEISGYFPEYLAELRARLG